MSTFFFSKKQEHLKVDIHFPMILIVLKLLVSRKTTSSPLPPPPFPSSPLLPPPSPFSSRWYRFLLCIPSWPKTGCVD